VTVSRNEWKYWAEVVLELDPELPHIQCFPGDLNQVVLNLIVNAAHAIEDAQQRGLRAGKGKIVIATRLDGESIVIRVTDDGIGIPEAIRSRIFEPFFTTKQVGRGTGQGLSIARMLIERKHGGTLRFETKDGVGTSFEVRVPTQRGAD
jgi:signal transduction histidine kinase